jgi:[acyl-carrier-protein] S-malonyltransferase
MELVNNVDASVEADPARIKDALVRQSYSPVRWVETIQRMVGSGVTHIVECGPGKVLAGLTRRISAETQSFALADRASLEQALQAIKGT